MFPYKQLADSNTSPGNPSLPLVLQMLVPLGVSELEKCIECTKARFWRLADKKKLDEPVGCACGKINWGTYTHGEPLHAY